MTDRDRLNWVIEKITASPRGWIAMDILGIPQEEISRIDNRSADALWRDAIDRRLLNEPRGMSAAAV